MTETKLFIVLNNIKRNSMIIKVLKLKIFNLFPSLFDFLIRQLMTVYSICPNSSSLLLLGYNIINILNESIEFE